MKKRKCDCHKYERQVCDICQGVDPKNPAKDKLSNEEIIEAIKRYLKTTRKKLKKARENDSEYNSSLGNGICCFEASSMFAEVEFEIGRILES
jgi:hypothetical protein